jgi:hypothetical protein
MELLLIFRVRIEAIKLHTTSYATRSREEKGKA